MTKPRSIDEIYKEVGTLTFKGHHYVRRRNLKKQLKQLLLSEMPKTKKPTEDEFLQYNHGYNIAIKEMTETIERIMG